ncbi:MAG: PRC-barrel domain-containing protein, partial [Candidatus Woesearchaeota archaeon]|nr:PRC-barrel domain-containing protein [Candidatus Woesearchaeota archaeon]
MKEIRETNKEHNSGLRVNELKGKKVIASNGKEIGTIIEVRLDPNSFVLDGIEMDRGFFGLDTFIGRNYIDSLSIEGAVLNMVPVTDYKGLLVIDSTGKKVGNVKEIRTEGRTNNISAIIVGTGLLSNDVIFSKSDVKSVGESIILTSAFDSDAVKVGGQT